MILKSPNYLIFTRRKKAYNFFLETKVPSYRNKMGHFTESVKILSKEHYFYVYWENVFDLLKQIANALNQL